MATIVRDVGGVRAEELAPRAAPTPSPQAGAAPPPPSRRIAVPDGLDPGTSALRILAAVDAGAADATRMRAARVLAEAEEWLEQARLSPMGLELFVLHAYRRALLRDRLIRRAAALDGRPADQPADAAAVVHAEIRSVRRWADGEQLRTVRAQMIEAARAELAEIQEQLSAHLPSYHSPADGADPLKWHAVDAWIERVEGYFRRRDELRDRLRRLGDDQAARAAGVAAAIAAAGPGKVAAVVAAQMPASRDRSADVQRRIQQLATQAAATDPMTRLWQALGRDKARLEAELDRARQAELDEQAAAASRVVSAASQGTLGAILALERLVASLPELASALAQLRGTDEQLAGVVGVLIERAEADAKADAGRKAALAPPRNQDPTFIFK